MSKILTFFAIGVVVVSLGLMGGLLNEKDKNFDCNDLGIIYLKPSEKEYMQYIKDDNLIVSIPEEDLITAKTEILNCYNIDLYLGYLK